MIKCGSKHYYLGPPKSWQNVLKLSTPDCTLTQTSHGHHHILSKNNKNDFVHRTSYKSDTKLSKNSIFFSIKSRIIVIVHVTSCGKNARAQYVSVADT